MALTEDPPPRHAPTDSSMRGLGTMAVAAAMFAFGVNNVIVRTTDLSGMVTASYRLWIGVALLVGVLVASGRRPSLEGLRTALLPGLAYGGAILLFFSAFKATSIANATLIAALQSGVSLTVVGRWFGEKVRPLDLTLTFVATVGVAMVILGGEVGSGSGRLEGDLLAAAGMLSNTAYFVLGKRARARSPVEAGDFQVGLLVVAAVMTVPFVLATSSVPMPSSSDWLRLGVLALGGTAGHLGINWAHRHTTLTAASLLTLAVPVVSSTIAWIVLDEVLGPLQWAGAAVTLSALAAVVVHTVRPMPAVSRASGRGGGRPLR